MKDEDKFLAGMTIAVLLGGVVAPSFMGFSGGVFYYNGWSVMAAFCFLVALVMSLFSFGGGLFLVVVFGLMGFIFGAIWKFLLLVLVLGGGAVVLVMKDKQKQARTCR